MRDVHSFSFVRNRPGFLGVLLLTTAIFLSRIPACVSTGVACKTTAECQENIRMGSECLATGFCSNPFHKGGCLANMLQEYNNNNTKKYLRVCSSADPPEAQIMGYCAPAEEWGHMEIRFMGNNWESVFFETWIAQILLSEILGVPTSIDTGYADLRLDFYDIESRMDYGKGNDYDALKRAAEVGDCRLVKQSQNESEYKSCSHVYLEVWAAEKSILEKLEEEEAIEKPMALGVLGIQGWHIPYFTAERDPSLTSFHGLMGEHNRYKLAERFKRPTKWVEYCAEISSNNCSTPDEVAQRAPEESEEGMMFSEGVYTGYFRKTEENDCVKYPFNCTGHVADYPCGWNSFTQQWTHHLDIALASSGDEPNCRGYTYSQLTEIWAAANATKSDVLMYWWSPESLLNQFIGTDAEFQRITFPVPTQKCSINRVRAEDRCLDDFEKRVGSPDGVCDEEPQNLVKALTKVVFETSNDPLIPLSKRSPAYEAIKNFEMTGLHLGIIFDKWLTKGLDKWNYDPREATCSWVVENFDVVESFIPRTYPRVMQDGKDSFKEPLMYTAFVVGLISLVIVIGVACAVYKFRNRKVMQIAQLEFLFLLLCGLIMVQSASFVLAVPSTNLTCIASVWLKNLGYTLELIPLIVKVSAINRLLSAAKKMRRVKLERSRLLFIVSFLTFLMAAYLMIWTLLDPYNRKTNWELTDRITENGETVVEVLHYCASNNEIWTLIALSWRSLLLLWATVLAFQTRNCPTAFNESKSIAVMIYSQFVLLIWNLVLFFLQDKLNVAQVGRYQSLLLSIDVAAACCIYFVPKLLTTDMNFAEQMASRNSVRVSGISGVSENSSGPHNNTGSATFSGGRHSNHGIADDSSAATKNRSIDFARRKFGSFDSFMTDDDDSGVINLPQTTLAELDKRLNAACKADTIDSPPQDQIQPQDESQKQNKADEEIGYTSDRAKEENKEDSIDRSNLMNRLVRSSSHDC